MIQKNFFGGLKWTFKVKNRPVNKDHEVRGQVSTTFSEFLNLGLMVKKFLLYSSIKTFVILVLVSFYQFHTPCFDFGLFLGVMPNEEKKTY